MACDITVPLIPAPVSSCGPGVYGPALDLLPCLTPVLSEPLLSWPLPFHPSQPHCLILSCQAHLLFAGASSHLCPISSSAHCSARSRSCPDGEKSCAFCHSLFSLQLKYSPIFPSSNTWNSASASVMNSGLEAQLEGT